MNVTLAYRGNSQIVDAGSSRLLRLVPNLARDPVGLDAPLLKPLRYREAMSALHDVVINDLRYKPRDKTAYEQWKKDAANREASVRREAYGRAIQEMEARRDSAGNVAELQRRYGKMRRQYWDARQKYSNYLLKHDRDLWRKLMPCDPVITVAEDVAFFECFSADESSYGCLSVNRGDGFGDDQGTARLGTTNVDYSWDLYHHFQSLRSYRETRFRIDPEGFEVHTSLGASAEPLREEKIDLPQGWLRGFMQIQSAMALPATRLTLSRELVYSMVAFLKRHRAWKSPRAIRFELVPGKPLAVVLEPWEQRIEDHAGTSWNGPPIEPIRIWGGKRLLVLARLLPLAERFEVHLLGTGLPSFWVAHLGEMRLTLGLSGWTANDWTRSSAVDMAGSPAAPPPDTVNNVAAVLHERRSATLDQIAQQVGTKTDTAAEALRQLAHAGQVIYDLSAARYRWRQIMPRALGEAEVGPEHPELLAARQLMAANQAELESRIDAPSGGYILGGKVGETPVEILVDLEGRIRRGKCVCSYFHRFGIRNGPCRHMLALRWRSSVKHLEAFRASSWYKTLKT